MQLSLKVVRDTTLKLRSIDSTQLPESEKSAISKGEYELHSWNNFDEDEGHLRVAFLNDSFKGRNTWLVFIGHVEIWKDDFMLRPLLPATSTLLKNYTPCGTAGLNGLDRQIIQIMNEIIPNVLVDCSDLDIRPAGPEVHPFVQSAAKEGLRRAIQIGGRPLRLNSTYRTIAQQLVLFRQKQQGRCGRGQVAFPGLSNHQSGLAIDTPDFDFWRTVLPNHGWRHFGPGDLVHFDFVGGGTRDIGAIATRAFQRLWNRNNLTDQIVEDGDIGTLRSETIKRLLSSPVEGFGTSLSGFRGLRLTEPPFMEGDDVRKVQQALINAGLSVGAAGADGQYGPATFAAVKQFQAQKGLLVDGVVGAVTLKALGILNL